MVSLPLRDRPFHDAEFQALRLVLSTYRDGSGQNQTPAGSMPGFRDFERGVASVIGGVAAENKGVFDVVRTVPGEAGYGISCKMAQLAPADRRSAFVELSNAAATFRRHLLSLQINWFTEPGLAGPALLKLISTWHRDDAERLGLDLDSSKYLILGHSRNWEEFQLSAYPLDLYGFNPIGDIEWTSTRKRIDGTVVLDGRPHTLWQWWPDSGGQLKWWPPLAWATWHSSRFDLELPAPVSPVDVARDYFPDSWPAGFRPA